MQRVTGKYTRESTPTGHRSKKISFETDISNELSLSSHETFVGNTTTWHSQINYTGYSLSTW